MFLPRLSDLELLKWLIWTSFASPLLTEKLKWPHKQVLMFSPERKAREAPSVCVIFGLWASLLFQPSVKEELTPSTDAYSHPSETFIRLT